MKCSYYLSTIAAGLLLGGCASRPLVQERGWIGGEFADAKPHSWLTMDPEGLVIGAFPQKLHGKYESGLVITQLSPTAPLARAGLKESDLIVSLNDQPVGKLEHFLENVDETTPGTPL